MRTVERKVMSWKREAKEFLSSSKLIISFKVGVCLFQEILLLLRDKVKSGLYDNHVGHLWNK